jgi:hypothetical protein
MYCNRRRPGIVDFLVTPNALAGSYQIFGGASFDATTHLQLFAFGQTGFRDDTINPAVLDMLNQGDRIRVVFDPAQHGLTDTVVNYLQLKYVTAAGGGAVVMSPVTMLLPDSMYHGYQVITVNGSAPQGAAPVNSTQIDLSRLARDLQVVNQSATNGLWVGTDAGGDPYYVAPGAQYTTFIGTVSSLFVRGAGGTVAFSASFTHAMRLLIPPRGV